MSGNDKEMTNVTDVTDVNIEADSAPLANREARDDSVAGKGCDDDGTAEDSEPQARRTGFIGFISRIPLMYFILVFSAAGVGLGIMLSSSNLSETQLKWIDTPGELWFRALGCLIAPLIFSNVVVGLYSLSGLGKSGAIGWRTFLYYMVTTIIASGSGVGYALIFRGLFHGSDQAVHNQNAPVQTDLTIEENLHLQLFALVPNNIITAASADGNVLSVLTFAVFFGIFLSKLKLEGTETPAISDFIMQLNRLVMNMIGGALLPLLPLALFFKLTATIASTHDTGKLFRDIGLVAVCVEMGLLVQMFIVDPILYIILTRKNPLAWLKIMVKAHLTAFTTSSSAMTLPTTMDCVIKGGGVPKAIATFVLSLGATVNMNGTSVYLPIAAIYLSAVANKSVTVANIISVVLSSTLGSVGSSPIPNAGTVMIILVYQSSFSGPVPGEIALLIALDALLTDRSQTAVNVSGDSFAAAIMHHLTGGQAVASPEETEAQKKTVRRLTQGMPDEDAKRTIRKSIGALDS